MSDLPARRRLFAALTWSALGVAVLAPIAIAASSPYLASRGPAYIVGSFAGIVALALFLVQPLLIAGYLAGPRPARCRRWHRRIGTAIVASVLLHVGGLYLTSPPDALDALLLVSPTPFSVYGVIALWGTVLTAGLVALRHRIGLRYQTWRLAHNALAFVVVLATVIHAVQIEGTMGNLSKWALCLLALAATAIALLDLRVIRPLRRRAARPTG